MLSRRALSVAVVLSCAALICADDNSKRISNTTAVFRPVAEHAPSGNAAMFVGINEFSNDPNISPLRFAVHDAVELAHLFVVRLKLIPAANCHVALSGSPFVDSVKQHLTELKRLGVQVIEADKADMLKALLKVRGAAKDESNLLIISISSHGFDDGRVPYVMPRDGLRAFLADTAIKLRSIEEQMQLSNAGHRLFLVDACQEKVSFAAEKAIATKTASAMNATFAEALKQPTGQAKLTSCDVGEFSYEYGGLRGCGHGVFTATLLDALDGGAPADEDGLVRMRSVADFVHNGVNHWIEEMKRSGGGDMKQSPAWFGPKSAESLPLAVKAGDVVTLIANLRDQKLPTGFSDDLRNQLIGRLEKTDSSNPVDRELIASTRQFVDGELSARFFLPYVRDVLDQTKSDLSVNTSQPDQKLPIVEQEAVKASSPSNMTVRPSPPITDENQTLESVAGETRTWGQPDITFCWCPSGRFKMGSNDSDPDAYSHEKPQVRVRLSQGFWISQTEITQRQWASLMMTEPWSEQNQKHVGVGPEYPAVFVNYDDAVEFCQKLTQEHQQSGVISSRQRYTLPTEAQWEYACRSGSTSRFSFGDESEKLVEYAWIRENSSRSNESHAHEVRRKTANDWNLHDMHGNVWEWCLDAYADHPAGGDDPYVVDSTDENAKFACRGGSWAYAARFSRTASRKSHPRNTRNGYLGFRVALVSTDLKLTTVESTDLDTKMEPLSRLPKTNPSAVDSDDSRKIDGVSGNLFANDGLPNLGSMGSQSEPTIGNEFNLSDEEFRKLLDQLEPVESSKLTTLQVEIKNLSKNPDGKLTLRDPFGKRSEVGPGSDTTVAVSILFRNIEYYSGLPDLGVNGWISLDCNDGSSFEFYVEGKRWKHRLVNEGVPPENPYTIPLK